jgi:hypothetical protein
MFKDALLNFTAAAILVGGAIFFALMGYQHACLVIERNRLNTQIEAMITEKALLQSFINKQAADEPRPLGWISPSILD